MAEFRITITEIADSQLKAFTAREQRIIESAVLTRLRFQPSLPSHAIKRLRPNPLAEFELRVGDFRILYNVEVDNSEVVLLIVGRKTGDKLIVEGEEFHGHRPDPPQSAQDEPASGA
jgi:mRNA-degrading endonuclease RelE of RelBE toxin-antitoxin system